MLYAAPPRVLESLSPSNQFFGAEADEEIEESADRVDAAVVVVGVEAFALVLVLAESSATPSELEDAEPSSV